MAIQSPGAVDYHLTNQVGNLSFNPLAPCSLVVWISGVLSTGATNSQIGTYNTYTSGGTAVQMGVRNAAGRFVVWTWGAGVLVDTQSASGGLLVTIPDNVWTHYAYTFDGTYHNLYVNGVLINQVNNSTGVSVTTGVATYSPQLAGTITAVFINGYPTGGANETGTFSFSDISHFNRTLSAAEVLTMYSCGGPKDGIIYSEVSSYFCNEGNVGATVTSVVDESGGGNILTPYGTATGVNFTYVTDVSSGDTRPPL